MTERKKSVLIIGASGFIGAALFRHLKGKCCGDFRVTGTAYSSRKEGLAPLDITKPADLEQLILHDVPDFIIIAAGNKNVPACETDYERAFALNTLPVISLISIITRHRLPTRLIYISTDYVFNGNSGMYRDTDPPDPSTGYGKTKFLAEQALLSSAIGFTIVRTGAVMGRGGIFFDWLLRQMETRESIAIFDNIFFSPTPLAFLSDMVETAIRQNERVNRKILHVVGEKRLSRYAFAQMVQAVLNADVTIRPEKNTGAGSTFQHDLSMVPSDVINTWRKRTFEEYLRDEILC